MYPLLRNSDRNHNHKQKVLTYIASKQHRLAEGVTVTRVQSGRVKKELKRKRRKKKKKEKEEELHS